MEIEATLRQACGEGSSLTRSFWYGKFLQLLPEEETLEHIQSIAHHDGAQLTPLSSSETVGALPSQPMPMGGKEEKMSQLTHAQSLSSHNPDHGSSVDSSIHLDPEKPGDKYTMPGITDDIESNGDVSSLDLEPHIVEAVKCLKHRETSLSPNVHDLVVNSIQLSSSEHLVLISESTFLLKDCILDWDVVSLHLNNGNVVTSYDLNNLEEIYMIQFTIPLLYRIQRPSR